MKYKLRYKSREKNIYLVGLMGTGKSTIGKILASRLKMDFIDSDQTIEMITGNSISQIFTHKGEEHFRSLEKKFIKDGHPEKKLHHIMRGRIMHPIWHHGDTQRKGFGHLPLGEELKLSNRTKMDQSDLYWKSLNRLKLKS